MGWNVSASLGIPGVLALLPLACSHTTGGPAEVRSSLSRDTTPNLAPSDEAALESGNVAFAVDLYQALRAGPGNLAFSPTSLSIALAMTYAGARGTTASEIAQALHLSLAPDAFQTAFDWLGLQLASRGAQTAPGAARPFTLNLANALWVRPHGHYEEPFLDTLAVDYGAGLNLADFAGDPAGTTRQINAWTSDQTNGRILNLLPSGAVDPSTQLVLVDALYFDAAWMVAFDKNVTAARQFTRADGSTVSATMMSEVTTHGYAAGPDYRAIELTYEGGLAALDIVMPAAASFEAGLTAQSFSSLVAGLRDTTVALTMPRFRLAGASTSLASTLQHLGIHAAFEPGVADFTGITATGDIFVKDVFHEAFVAVDEDGTQAAAASAVVFDDAGVAFSQVSLVIDHPFLFAVRDLPTGAILFMGWVADPT